MRISKRTREQAALICAIAASTPMSLMDAELSCGGDAAAWGLCWEARCAVNDAEPYLDPTTRYAEAEALLRTGWSP